MLKIKHSFDFTTTLELLFARNVHIMQFINSCHNNYDAHPNLDEDEDECCGPGDRYDRKRWCSR